MKKETYTCPKCGFTFIAEKKQDKIEKVEEHRLTGCTGSLQTASGDCFIQAYKRMGIGVLFCVGDAFNAAGFAYKHAWNEMGGVAYDYSDGKKIILNADDYYKIKGLNNIMKYDWEEFKKKVNKALKEGKDRLFYLI